MRLEDGVEAIAARRPVVGRTDAAATARRAPKYDEPEGAADEQRDDGAVAGHEHGVDELHGGPFGDALRARRLSSRRRGASTCPKTASPRRAASPIMRRMTLDADAAYLALQAHDARFDGRLFVGVTSTGIYCRPICRVRTPRRENCRFFANAAQAEARALPALPALPARAGAGPRRLVGDGRVAHAGAAGGARCSTQRGADGRRAPALPRWPARLGVSDRHLRRIFAGRSTACRRCSTCRRGACCWPSSCSPTRALPVTQVALASGFRSLRRFNAAFVERYRLNPSALRARRARRPMPARRRRADAAARLSAAVRRRRRCSASSRARALRRRRGGRRARHGAARCALDAPRPARRRLARAALRAAARSEVELRDRAGAAPARRRAGRSALRQALDLDADPARSTPRWRRCRSARPGLRVPGSVDGFETGGARRARPAGHGGRGAHADAAPGRALRRADRDAVRRPAPRCSRRRRRSPTPIADAIGKLGIVRQRVRRAAGAGARGGRWPHRAAPRRAARRHARRAARAAGHRRMDRAVHRDARAAPGPTPFRPATSAC